MAFGWHRTTSSGRCPSLSNASKPLSKIDHYFYHDKHRKQPWVVRWWPEGREGRGSRECKQCSRGFATSELRDAFVENGFQEDPLQAKVPGKGRKRADQDREQRENPENWPDELSEVMARVTEIRANSGRRYSLLSDVYAAMKQLGFKRPSERVQHHADVHAST